MIFHIIWANTGVFRKIAKTVMAAVVTPISPLATFQKSTTQKSHIRGRIEVHRCQTLLEGGPPSARFFTSKICVFWKIGKLTLSRRVIHQTYDANTITNIKCILLISTVANKFPDRDAGDSQFSAVQPDAATEIQWPNDAHNAFGLPRTVFNQPRPQGIKHTCDPKTALHCIMHHKYELRSPVHLGRPDNTAHDWRNKPWWNPVPHGCRRKRLRPLTLPCSDLIQ